MSLRNVFGPYSFRLQDVTGPPHIMQCGCVDVFDHIRHFDFGFLCCVDDQLSPIPANTGSLMSAGDNCQMFLIDFSDHAHARKEDTQLDM